jgi:hypothetical protein
MTREEEFAELEKAEKAFVDAKYTWIGRPNQDNLRALQYAEAVLGLTRETRLEKLR